MKKIIALVLSCISLALGAQVKDSLELSMPGAVSVESLIEGKVAGLDVSAESGSRVGALSLALRGVNSLSSSSQPMWIVDGSILTPSDAQTDAPFWQYGSLIWAAPQSSMLGFNVYDVESIEVIKDLSSAALYGANGANGVIVVKTKSGSGNGVRLYADIDAASLAPVINISAGNEKNRNRYYLSGHFRGLNGESSYGREGGFRFNFDTRRARALSLGLNASASIASFGDDSPAAEKGGDVDDDSDEHRSTDSFWMELELPWNVRLRADVGVDYRAKKRYIWYGEGTAFGIANNGAASLSSLEQLRGNASFAFDWSRWFGKGFLSLSARADAIFDEVTSSVMTGFDFFDYGLRARGINLAGSAAKLQRSDYSYSRMGAAVRAEFSYDGIAGADASFRIDGNDGFGGRLLYPSANVFLDLRKLIGHGIAAVSSAKLTAGWGNAGLVGFVPYLHFGDYSQIYPVQADYDLQAFFRGRSVLKSSEFNAGLELGLFSDRLRAAVKYYDKDSEDSFSVYCNGREFGTNGYWKYDTEFKDFEQWGSVRNRGIEVSLDAGILTGGDLFWSAGLTAAFNANIVKGVPYTSTATDGFLARWAYSDVAGYAPGVIVGFDGENGAIKDHSGDGRISDADRIVLGNTRPGIVAGLSTSLSWRRFALDALVTGRFGGKYIDFASLFAADSAEPALITREFVKSADMIRLAHVTFSYDVPIGRASSFMGLKLRLSASGPSAPSGALPFKETGSYVAGICLTL